MSNTRHTRQTDNVYLNVTINNDNTDGTRKVAQFLAEYENPILDDPSEFSLAVVKFQIPLDELPLFIVPVTPGQTLTPGSTVPIQTPFKVGVYQVEPPGTIVPPVPAPALTTGFEENITWIPTWWNYPNPTSAGGTIDLDSIKYSPLMYVYSYQTIVNRINVALNAAWVAAGSPGGAGAVPYYIYADNRFQLILPFDFTAAGANGWSVYVDSSLLEPLQGFTYNISSNGQRFQVPIDYLPLQPQYWASVSLQPLAAAPVAGDVYKIPQEYTSFEYLSSARKLVMTSNTIPARKEYFPVPTNFQNTGQGTGVNNGLGIISDFQLDLTNSPGEQRSIATYEADLYRMVDLTSTHPMRKIDLNFFWSDQFNNLFPLYLSPYGNINVKLGFFNKKQLQMTKSKNKDITGSGYSVFR